MQEEEIKEVLGAWDITDIMSVETPNTGKVNTTLVIDSARGKFALRKYRHTEPARVQSANDVIAFVAAHGMPAVCPISTPSGESMLLLRNGLYALFPFVEGEQLGADTLRVEQVEAMGGFLGDLHNVLRTYSSAKTPQRSFQVDSQETLDKIKAIEERIVARDAEHPTDEYALQRLRGQKTWVESKPENHLPQMQTMEWQVVHGDYQLSNLFFVRNVIEGIIDWDGTGSAPRLWEVVRCLDYTFGFRVQTSLAFLKKYHATSAIDIHQLNRMAHCYGYVEDHRLWAFEAVYFRGEDRARSYLKPGAFVPIVKRWQPLWTRLLADAGA